MKKQEEKSQEGKYWGSFSKDSKTHVWVPVAGRKETDGKEEEDVGQEEN